MLKEPRLFFLDPLESNTERISAPFFKPLDPGDLSDNRFFDSFF